MREVPGSIPGAALLLESVRGGISLTRCIQQRISKISLPWDPDLFAFTRRNTNMSDGLKLHADVRHGDASLAQLVRA